MKKSDIKIGMKVTHAFSNGVYTVVGLLQNHSETVLISKNETTSAMRVMADMLTLVETREWNGEIRYGMIFTFGYCAEGEALEYYMLSSPGRNKFVAINLNNGNRWNEACDNADQATRDLVPIYMNLGDMQSGIKLKKKEPKMVMVELTVDDVEYLSNRSHAPDTISNACKKALERN